MQPEFDAYHKWLAIPPSEQPPNHYRLLGLPLFEADPDVISHAADQRMAHLRTFQTGRYGAESQKILNQISTARLCLLDPPKKQAYDQQLRAQEESLRPPPPPPVQLPLPESVPHAPVAQPPQETSGGAASTTEHAATAEDPKRAEEEYRRARAAYNKARQRRWRCLGQIVLVWGSVGYAQFLARVRRLAPWAPLERQGAAMITTGVATAGGLIAAIALGMGGTLLLAAGSMALLAAVLLALNLFYIPSDERLRQWEFSQRQRLPELQARLRQLAEEAHRARQSRDEARTAWDRLRRPPPQPEK